jgi:hypothetical protein
VPLGRVGAGTGATVAKWRGRDHTRPGGIGAAGATVVVTNAAITKLDWRRPVPHGPIPVASLPSWCPPPSWPSVTASPGPPAPEPAPCPATAVTS